VAQGRLALSLKLLHVVDQALVTVHLMLLFFLFFLNFLLLLVLLVDDLVDFCDIGRCLIVFFNAFV